MQKHTNRGGLSTLAKLRKIVTRVQISTQFFQRLFVNILANLIGKGVLLIIKWVVRIML